MNSKLKPHQDDGDLIDESSADGVSSDELEWESSEWERLQSDDGSDSNHSGEEESDGDQEVDGGIIIPTTLA